MATAYDERNPCPYCDKTHLKKGESPDWYLCKESAKFQRLLENLPKDYRVITVLVKYNSPS